jgi:glycine/D-amino acid oxidase-like deaminating enzyme
MESSGLHADALRPPLRGVAKADVAIVGGGFTGLATAIAVPRRQPRRRVVVLEGARCGYGASGRNGGFADVNYMAFPQFAATQDPQVARALYELIETGRTSIERLAAEAGVLCDFEHNGALRMASSDAQIEQMERMLPVVQAMGLASKLIDGAELQARVRTGRFRAAMTIPGTAILNPGKLVRGMARAAEALGVAVHEGSRVVRIEPGNTVRIETELGRLDAGQLVLATNGYTPQLGIFRQRLLPLCNYVVATEPLSPQQWQAIGWSGREALTDARVLFMYLRPTADGRIVAGGELATHYWDGAPSGGNHARAIRMLEQSLIETFPALAGIRFSHAWGGTMAFTRDLTPRIGALADAPNVLFALGYCGEGVVMSQLAGRIVAAMLAGDGGEFAGLPFVGGAPPWVGPEPLRTLGVRAVERAMVALAGEG